MIKTVKATIIILFFSTLASSQDYRNPLFAKPLDDQILVYQQLARQLPRDIKSANRLAYAYIQKVRATQDQNYNMKAEQLLERALALDPKNYDSLIGLSLVEMSKHRFVQAKEIARKAVEARPGDSTGYGMLGDAAYELGLYGETSRAYQKMMDLRPSVSSYSRAAFYRRIIGDLDGAIECMGRALQLVDVRDNENQSWCLFQLGNFFFARGKLRQAEESYNYSLRFFPDYYNSLAGLAKVKAAQGDRTEAIGLYQRAIAVVPMPDFIAALGDLYAISGDSKKANDQYALVEYIGVLGNINREIYNRQLALFYADHDINTNEAVKLSSRELSFRKDVFGYDALAWSLFKNNQTQQALPLMRKALSMRTRDPLLYFHAGMIFEKSGFNMPAKKYFADALSLNPEFHPIFAQTAKERLAILKKER